MVVVSVLEIPLPNFYLEYPEGRYQGNNHKPVIVQIEVSMLFDMVT
jgi:hypothetical protein